MADEMKIRRGKGQVRYTNPNADLPYYYANNAEISISNWDMKIRLGQIDDTTDDGVVMVKNLVTLFMSVDHARVFADKLRETLAVYDKFNAENKA